MTEKPLRVFSYGGGWQSTAVLILQITGQLKRPFDAFVFANVGNDSENPGTLEYVHQYVEPACAARGIRFETVQKTWHGKPDSVYRSTLRDDRSLGIPAVFYPSRRHLNRNCTGDFKIKRVDKWVRAQKVERCVIGIGFSLDEQKRIAKKPTGWHDRPNPKSKEGFGFWKKFEFPLSDMQLGRRDLPAIIKAFGWPMPPKSACWFCPFRSRNGWIEMKRNEPELFNRAIAFQDAVRAKAEKLGTGNVWLH